MSRVADEPKHLPSEAEADAALRDLRQQVENARQRLAGHWNQIRAVEVTLDDDHSDHARE
jgi:hypothetical protein